MFWPWAWWDFHEWRSACSGGRHEALRYRPACSPRAWRMPALLPAEAATLAISTCQEWRTARCCSPRMHTPGFAPSGRFNSLIAAACLELARGLRVLGHDVAAGRSSPTEPQQSHPAGQDVAPFGFSHSQVAATVVTASGSLTEPRPADLLMVQALTGARADAIVTLRLAMKVCSLFCRRRRISFRLT